MDRIDRIELASSFDLHLAPRVQHGLKMNLQLFGEGAGGEKTEEATPKKREKAREDGQVAKSTEITTTFILVVMFSTLRILGGRFVERLLDIFNTIVLLFDTENIDIKFVGELFSYVGFQSLMIIGPVFAVAFFIALISNVLQVGWKPTMKPLEPKLSKISPLEGLKRMFSLKTMVELIKSLIKIGIILIIVYLTIRDYERLLFDLMDMPIMQAYGLIINIALNLGIRIGAFFLIVALIDYIYQRYSLSKKLRMSKQEIKDEYKMSEGNPEIKQQIKQRMREASMRRMMQDLPQADVVITNPTHFAVAVKYDESVGSAPVVVAKGADILAGRIKEKAKEFDIEIVENKPLARTLYYTVEIGDEVPPELYQTVAEVLAFVYNLKNSR